jgi:hypothetical protein
MPAAPLDKQPVRITTTQTITTFTLSANAGQSILGAPTTLPINTSVEFKYLASASSWIRLS